jgi:hypothetical protein
MELDQLAPFGGLAAILAGLGRLIKAHTKIHNDLIPFILGAIGALLVCAVKEEWTQQNAMQGLLVAYLTASSHAGLKAAGVLKKSDGTTTPPTPPPAALVILLLALLLASGCTTYNERFTKMNDDGSTNHVVHVNHMTFLVVGKAAKLRTETQTGEFIRSVNAEDVSVKGDAESIKALGTAIGQAAGETINAAKAINGIP